MPAWWALSASLVTTSRMQQCFNVLIDIYHEFLLLFYCCVLLEIKLTTYYYYVLRDQENAHTHSEYVLAWTLSGIQDQREVNGVCEPYVILNWRDPEYSQRQANSRK